MENSKFQGNEKELKVAGGLCGGDIDKSVEKQFNNMRIYNLVS